MRILCILEDIDIIQETKDYFLYVLFFSQNDILRRLMRFIKITMQKND